MKTDATRNFVSEIRLLKIEEIDGAVDLLIGQLHEHGSDTDSGRVRSVIEQIIHDDRLGFVLVATGGNRKLIGVALGCTFLGDEHGGKSGWLEELYVLPEFRSHGSGALLLAEFIRIAESRSWRAIDVEVDSRHVRAASLYKRLGFEPLERSRLSRILKPEL